MADKVSGLTPMLQLTGDRTSAIAPERFIELARAHLENAEPAWDPYVVPVGVPS
jgi:hypothetical protein